MATIGRAINLGAHTETEFQKKPNEDISNNGSIEINPDLKINKIARLPIFDLQHKNSGDYVVTECSNDELSWPSTCDSYYVDIGTGSKIIVAMSPSDAISLIKTAEIERVIAPISQNFLVELCQKLAGDFYDREYVIFGTRSRSQDIAVAKRLLNADSHYPPDNFVTWREFESIEGAEAIMPYVLRADLEEQVAASYAVKDEHVINIGDERFIFKDLIIQQHIVVICAEPNAGKTTISNWICSQISELYKVRYLNLDCSGSDLKHYFEYAKRENFQFINFDITGTNDEEFFASLESCDELGDTVYFIDTLKKFTDLMGKASVKTFMKRLRSLCNKGATFVLLAHTNKHRTKEGLPVYEGVGDVKSDCDELIYLIPKSNDDGSKTVTTFPDKTRGHIEPITFRIEIDRSVTLTGYIDVLAANQKKIDEPVIATVINALSSGPLVQKLLVEICMAIGIGKHTATKILEQYSTGDQRLWAREKGENNAWVYALA